MWCSFTKNPILTPIWSDNKIRTRNSLKKLNAISRVRLSNKFIRYTPVMLWKIVINTSLVAVFKLSTSKHNLHFINQKRIFNFFTVINFSWRRKKQYKLDTHCALVYLSKCLFTIHVKAKTINWIGYENTLRAVSFLFQPFMSVITKAQQKPHWRKFNSRHCDAWLKKKSFTYAQ